MDMAIGDAKIRQMVVTALITALLCVLCPFSVPIGPVPVSFGVLAVYFVAYVLPPVLSVASTALYLLLGVIGLPVFAGYTSGPQRVAGPTGGYLIGYLFLAFFTSLAVVRAERMAAGGAAKTQADGGSSAGKQALRLAVQLLGMIVGLAVCYLFGTVWFSVQNGTPFFVALSVCVYPFLPVDAVKIACALVCGNALRAALKRARLI